MRERETPIPVILKLDFLPADGNNVCNNPAVIASPLNFYVLFFFLSNVFTSGLE